jgi:hypothetical protein
MLNPCRDFNVGAIEETLSTIAGRYIAWMLGGGATFWNFIFWRLFLVMIYPCMHSAAERILHTSVYIEVA